jgi:hypothetical protein
MRKQLSILFIGVLLSGCAGSRGCGCPNWGNLEIEKSHQQVVLQEEVNEVEPACI